MFKTVVRLIDRVGPQSDFERYLGKLQRLDAEGAPTREQAKRDFRDLRDRNSYNIYGMN
jgi:hypothetical protein